LQPVGTTFPGLQPVGTTFPGLQPVGMGFPGLQLRPVGMGGMIGFVVPGFVGFGFATFFAILVSFLPCQPGACRRAFSAREARAVDRGG